MADSTPPTLVLTDRAATAVVLAIGGVGLVGLGRILFGLAQRLSQGGGLAFSIPSALVYAALLGVGIFSLRRSPKHYQFQLGPKRLETWTGWLGRAKYHVHNLEALTGVSIDTREIRNRDGSMRRVIVVILEGADGPFDALRPGYGTEAAVRLATWLATHAEVPLRDQQATP